MFEDFLNHTRIDKMEEEIAELQEIAGKMVKVQTDMVALQAQILQRLEDLDGRVEASSET